MNRLDQSEQKRAVREFKDDREFESEDELRSAQQEAESPTQMWDAHDEQPEEKEPTYDSRASA